MTLSRPLTMIVVVLALLSATPPTADAARRVPQGWLGVTVDGPVRAGDAAEWNRMVRAGVESVRVAFPWSTLQPYADSAAVPPGERDRFRTVGGRPTDFGPTDALVATAARRGVAVLPVVQAPPTWAAVQPGVYFSPPADFAALERLFTALVERYGPRGSLWAQRRDLPRIPIRAWQVFNEPQIEGFWTVQPFESAYVETLRAARSGLRAADPRARVILGGGTNESWPALERIYAAGGGPLFDAVAVHPYTALPANVLRILRLNREVMARFGDGRKPLWVTELSWAAGRDRVPVEPLFDVTDEEQAARLDAVVPLLLGARERLRIERVFWYTWLTSEQAREAWDYAGLRRIRDGARIDAPALRIFRAWARRIAGCPKDRDARRCRQPATRSSSASTARAVRSQV